MWHPLSAPQTISGQWKDLEGQSVGAFTLHSYVGGSDQTAVFSTTRSNGEQAAIKLLPCDSRTSDLKLSRLQQAIRLSHPNLLKIYDSGVVELQSTNLVWALSQFAEEDLSQILPLRPLTVSETEQMISPLLSALSYLHREGFIHGRIKPSNIMAIGDQVKLSVDAVSVLGDPLMNALRTPYDAPEVRTGKVLPASDVWSLGMTIVDVLTQRLPSTGAGAVRIPNALPEPYHTIATRCLQIDARQRPIVNEVQGLLKRPPQTAAASQAVQQGTNHHQSAEKTTATMSSFEEGKRGPNFGYIPLLVLAVAVVIAGLLWLRNPANPTPSRSSSPADAAARTESPPTAVREEQSITPHPEPAPAETVPSVPAGVLRPILPQVSASARNTVTGRVRVAIRARVDADGNVVQTTFESHGPSDYFARKAKEAAQQWKFAPNAGEGVWLIRFGFGSKDTLASATRLIK
jgi:serine/threonine protein kinase